MQVLGEVFDFLGEGDDLTGVLGIGFILTLVFSLYHRLDAPLWNNGGSTDHVHRLDG